LGKFLPDVDRPNEGVFAWQDEDADWLALRYDLTAPLARVAAQYRNDLPSPYRRYAMGPVWRNEKPGPGRFRQFYQCDADTVGAPSVAADAEICAMLSDALEVVGIPRGDYIVRVNNRKVLNGVMEVAGVLDPTDPERFAAERGIVLRAIDKIDRLGEGGVRAFTRVHAAAQRHASYAYKQYLPYQLSDGVAEACCVCVARPQLRRTRHGAPYVALRLHARAACPPR
jgi:histidyl-tRNA synthetase